MRIACLTIMLFITAIAPRPSAAQMVIDDNDVISVRDMPNPDLNPLGIPLRSFYAHPALSVREEYNDNIFVEPENEEEDFITLIRPSLVVRSNWDRHALRVFADARLAVHAKNSNEDYEDFRVGTTGRYDIGYDTFFDGELRYEDNHEDRSSPDDAESDAPTQFDVFLARIGFTRALGRLKLFLNGRLRDIEFDNAVAANGSVFIDNSFRSRTQKELDAKLAYEFIPNYEVFIRGIYDARDYETTPFPDRTSKGYRVEAGTAIKISGKVKGEIHGGYIDQNYRDSFEDVSTADYGASLLWNLSALTSLSVAVDRDVVETTGALTSGYIRTAAKIETEHAFNDNVIGIVEVNYFDDSFVGITREDDTFGANIELEYRPFRGGEASLRYGYRKRESDLTTEDFSNHRISLRLGYTF